MHALISALLTVLVLAAGAFFTLYLGFFPFRHLGLIRRQTAASLHRSRDDGLSPFQSVCTALSATVGTGNVAGVAAALELGGPGALFWMWIAALLGMATGFAENVLGVAYRVRTRSGCQGGSMYPLSLGLGLPGLASLSALACLVSAIGVGCIVQGASIGGILQSAFSLPPPMSAAALALLAAPVFFGGARRTGQIAALLVPAMLLLYVASALICILLHVRALPQVLTQIFTKALSPRAFLSGTAWSAIRHGVSRGVFSNEAGLGTSAFAHASAPDAAPLTQGCWSAAETAIDTLLICTLTGLVILTSGAHGTGADWTAAAFSATMGPIGQHIVALCLTLFAFSTILGWGHFSAVAADFCFGPWGSRVIHVLMLLALLFSCRARLDAVWPIADLCSLLTAAPNLYACVRLRRQVRAVLDAASK
ncbi:MAG: sodium:alanine symporter family protein [Oscillospiraceae bacterium]|nr:sodium:alanine symporter family protein [Oscillospiraceae bacterium]